RGDGARPGARPPPGRPGHLLGPYLHAWLPGGPGHLVGGEGAGLGDRAGAGRDRRRPHRTAHRGGPGGVPEDLAAGADGRPVPLTRTPAPPAHEPAAPGHPRPGTASGAADRWRSRLPAWSTVWP